MPSNYIADFGSTPRPRAYAFMTRKDERVRTIGTIFFPPSRQIDLFGWGGNEAQAFSRMFERIPDAVTPAARGKVVFILKRDDGTYEVRCFQVKGQAASPTVCGNAGAASAVALAHETGSNTVAFTIGVGDKEIKVVATVDCRGSLVAQEWLIDSRPECVELEIANHRVVACDFLNPYFLIEGSLALRPSELLALAGYRIDANLNQKYAVIDTTRAIPYIRFFGCNGAHGAAPLSGIVTLALAARRVEWIKAALETGLFEHPMGVEVLPAIAMAGEGHSVVTLPEIQACTYAIAVI